MFHGPETESENCQTMWYPSSLVKPSQIGLDDCVSALP